MANSDGAKSESYAKQIGSKLKLINVCINQFFFHAIIRESKSDDDADLYDKSP